ncbi:hypothetical protein CEUSTIGMA_g10394.t1 [Chlamydomonas eustigma]|uniref:Uncharacterized protein n=1 Tax=Chlamydomonas eustigma TaxID=1157962 RepID=A0A250XIR1_9CHLO|nr:hypothetical protein CEUSTIGMA_g10394.t1 [Chlamydomonas eustigma]|eukprot:GAX82967.1 hypothetical protein CEUSTIGMA_g10394.t1 [Chlamydomonas eustigma]
MRFEVQTNLHPLGPGDLSNAFIVCSPSKHTVEQAINSALQVHVELVAHPKVTLQALSKVLKSVQCCGSINPGVLHTIPESNLSSLVDVAFPNQECAHLKLNYESEDVVRMLILGSGSSGHAVQPENHEMKTFDQAKGTTAVPIGARRQSIVQTIQTLAAGTTTSRLVDDLQGKLCTSSQQQLPKTGNPSTTATVAGPSSTSVQAANAARTGVALQPALKAVVASSQRGITAAATEQQIAAAGPRLRRPTSGGGGTSTNHVTMHQQGPTAATAVAVLQPSSTGNTTPRRATRAAASDVAAITAVELVLPQPKSKNITTEMTDIMGQAAPAVEAAMQQAGDAGSSSVTKDFRVRCGNKEGMLRLPQEQIKSNIEVFCHCSECMKSQSSMSTHRFEEHGGMGKSKSSLKSIKVLPDSTNPGAPKAIMSLKTWLISFKWGTEQAQDPAAVHPATAAAAGEAVARTREEKAGGSGAVRLYKTADLIKESAGTKRKRGGKDISAEGVAAATGVDVDDDDDEDDEEEEDVQNLMQTLNTKPSATDLKLGNKEFTGVAIHSNNRETSTGTTDRVFLLDVMCGTKEGQLMHYPGHRTMLKIKCMCSDCGRHAMGSTAVGDAAADADNLLMTPRQFEVHGGRGGSKNSGRSIKVVAHPTKPGAPRESMDLKTWLESFKTFGTERNKYLTPEAATTQQSADPPAFGDTRLHHPDKAGPSNAPALNALAAGRNSRQVLKKSVSTAAAGGSGALLFSSKQGGSASQTAAALIVKKALKMKTGSADPAPLTATAIVQQTASVDTVDKGLNIRQRARPHTASSPKTTKTKEPAAQPKTMPHNKASAPEVSNPKSAPNDNPAAVMYKVFKVNCGGHSGQVLYPMEPTKPLLLMCCCLSCGGERPPPTDFLITGAHPPSATTSSFMTPGQMEAHCGLGARRNGVKSIKMVVDESTAGAPKVNMDLRTWLSSLLWKSASPLDPELMYPVASGSVGTRNIEKDSDTAPQPAIATKPAATVSLKGQTRSRLIEVAMGSAAAEEMATGNVAGGSALKAAAGAEVRRVAGEIGTAAAAAVVPGSRAKAAAADEKEKRGAAASSRKRTAATAAMAAKVAPSAGKRLVGNQLNDQRDKSASIASRGQALQKTIKKRRQLSKSQVLVISDDSDEGVGYEDEDAHNEGGTSEGRPVTKRVKMVAAEHENVANDESKVEARKQDDKRVKIVGGEGDVVGEVKNSSALGMRTAVASVSGVGGVLMGAIKRKSGAFRRAAAEKAAEGNAAEVLAEFLELKGNIRLTRGSARLAEEEAVESLAALGSTRVGTRSSSGVEGASPGMSR